MTLFEESFPFEALNGVMRDEVRFRVHLPRTPCECSGLLDA